MAALCNFFVPGLGHLILGKPVQGLLWFAIVLVGYLCLIVPGIVLHIICIIDAARASQRRHIDAVARGVARGQRAR